MAALLSIWAAALTLCGETAATDAIGGGIGGIGAGSRQKPAFATRPVAKRVLSTTNRRDFRRCAALTGDDGDGAGTVPFFAAMPAPAFSRPGVDGGAGGATAPQSATVTTRLPLGKLFDGRDYVFVTQSNVRGYEWTTKLTDVLFDDLVDAALGTAVFANLDGDGISSGTTGDVRDYELSQIVLVPTTDWNASLLGLGNCYDVHDGQQRLVTMNLLLAALRDSFRTESRGIGAGRRAVALAATADEISSMLFPTKVRKADVVRIELRVRDNVVLRKILLGGDNGVAGGYCDDDEGDEGAEDEDLTPTEVLSAMTAAERKALSATNQRVLDNFLRFAERIDTLSTRERLRLLDYIVERLFLLVCVPETGRIARNIVMAQGKGMDNEPIDDFKGLVCFRYTLEEEDMYRTFDRWDALAAEPADSHEGFSPPLPVGRDTVSSACLLRATAALRTKIRSRGGDEVYEWERWLRDDLLRNKRQGKDFFASEIEPSSVALYKFRSSRWEEFSFIGGGGGDGAGSEKYKELVSSTVARLTFLRDLTSGATPAKEIEAVVLELLLRAEDKDGLALPRLDDCLRSVEVAALWMAIARPSPLQRHRRCFDLLDAIDDTDSVAGGMESAAASSEEKAALKESIGTYEFGATAAGKRIATALLKRFEAESSEGDSATVDLVLPSKPKGKNWNLHWPNENERDEWVNRIGNLALVLKRPTAKQTSMSFESKKELYGKEPWPLTHELSQLGVWNIETARARHKEILALIDITWAL